MIMGTPASLRDVQWLRKQILDERVCLGVLLLQRDFGPVGDLRNLWPERKISLSVIYFDNSFEHLSNLVCGEPQKIRTCSRGAPDLFCD